MEDFLLQPGSVLVWQDPCVFVHRGRTFITVYRRSVTTPLCLRCAQQREWNGRENRVSNRSCPDFIRNIVAGSIESECKSEALHETPIIWKHHSRTIDEPCQAKHRERGASERFPFHRLDLIEPLKMCLCLTQYFINFYTATLSSRISNRVGWARQIIHTARGK